MVKHVRWLCAVWAAVWAATQVAGATSVSNYNWLQLLPGQVTLTLQGGGTPTTGYGDPQSVRWGDWLWIPHGSFTQSGASDFSVTLEFDAPRLVESVKSQFWTREGTGLNRYFVEGSNDGTNWTTVGTDATPIPTGQYEYSRSLDVTDGTWKYVRMLIRAGDYSFGSASRGGPGILLFAPSGGGAVADTEVNWAHRPSFGTTATSVAGMDFRGDGINNGDMSTDDGGRVGDAGAWEAGEYARIDLGVERAINRVVIDWNDGWIGSAFDVQWSKDGVNFYNVGGASAKTVYVGDAATMMTFNLMGARYWQITNVSGNPSYNLLQQVMLYGLPEPGSACLLAVAAGTLAARRRRSPGWRTA